MANRIMTTHVGSLIRPPKFVEILHKLENKEPVEPGLYDKTLTESVAEVVRQQAEANVDIVSDGEFGKGRNWAFYVHGRLSGMHTRPMTPEELKDPLASVGGGRDRLVGAFVVVLRQPHAAEADAELRGGEPAGVTQAGP